MDLPSFNIWWWALKHASFLQQSAYRLFKVIQGRWFWYWKHMWLLSSHS